MTSRRGIIFQAVPFIPWSLKIWRIGYTPSVRGGLALLKEGQVVETWKPLGFGFFFKREENWQFNKYHYDDNGVLFFRDGDLEEWDNKDDRDDLL